MMWSVRSFGGDFPPQTKGSPLDRFRTPVMPLNSPTFTSLSPVIEENAHESRKLATSSRLILTLKLFQQNIRSPFVIIETYESLENYAHTIL